MLQKLKQNSDEFEEIGFVRSRDKALQLFGTSKGLIIGNILDQKALEPAMSGCQALVILTSAIPKMVAPPKAGERPVFEFSPGEMPETIDWLGQKNQIDAAKKQGIEHIVLVGSMGGTNENHPLNSLGNGKILIWKRKAEQYLINSGIDYSY
ncbi:hypothetical protein C7H19_22040 [Aphanothece hegewaldii CCALA 016]|uniref:NAD(P)-binding domain-containing protein n=1 Tax=Aphanothece hegewaldii CCALA 016 TaxID=2107694 RepID=A0A2T1LS56_9CHRO|nr:hypothetical protein C7H19_22040 [Aphanothece hegewaldii CCALA 016]